MPKFSEVFQDTGGASFIGSEEKKQLVADKTPLVVERAYFSVGGGYKGGDQYVVIVMLDGEERALGFGSEAVGSRDRFLAALIAYLDTEDAEPVTLLLEKSGQSYLVRDADAPTEE
jgi:hypothetical protein